MPEVWLPPKAHQEELHKRREFQADLEEKLVRHDAMAEYNRYLKQIDPYLELVWCPELGPDVDGERSRGARAVLKPNRYHLLRHNPGAPPTVKPYEGPDGEFLEPSSGLFDFVRQMDLWRDELVKDQRQKQETLERAKERQKARETAERQEEISYRLKAKESPGVLFGSNKWSAKAGARRRRSNGAV